MEAKLTNRITKDELIARNILKGKDFTSIYTLIVLLGNISGNILHAQLSLKFSMASDKLAQTLSKRPHREYLAEKNILKGK